mmetsp:Transcript_27667/g.84345  ORF Transcript_27667/g.84345 Transcript_27667/m.84345 type:complete len:340 (-) Transcript_27667:643-1662(-)
MRKECRRSCRLSCALTVPALCVLVFGCDEHPIFTLWRRRPVDFVSPHVLENSCDKKSGGWADSQVPNRELIQQRRSYELEKSNLAISFDEDGKPLNPIGRTGICNRGALGKWGANHAADPIVTRRNLNKSGRPLEVVVIKRRDTGEWAIPGGMVDPGELVSQTLRREFAEEAGNVPHALRAKFDSMAAQLFSKSNGKEVYRGYVDDPRNTDNAWMETVAMHFHCPDELGEMLTLAAGDDACDVKVSACTVTSTRLASTWLYTKEAIGVSYDAFEATLLSHALIAVLCSAKIAHRLLPTMHRTISSTDTPLPLLFTPTCSGSKSANTVRNTGSYMLATNT